MRLPPRGAAVALSLLLVLSAVAPIAATTTAASAPGPPDGMTGVPASNVGPPDHANAPDHAGPPSGAGPPSFAGPPADVPTDADAWEVLASTNAGTLTVEVGTTEDGRLALRLGDVEHHAGREVAVRTSTLVDALGYRPEEVSGRHESGERWTETVRYEGSHAVFSVPHFSTNVVTFDAAVSIQADPAVDGDTFRYELADVDAAENLSVTLTGRENTEAASTDAIAVDGDSVELDVGGTTDPRNASITFEGRRSVLDGTQVESYDEHSGTGEAVDVEDGVVYTASGDGTVVAYDPATDSVLWTHTEHTGTVTAVDADGDRVLSGDSDGKAVVVDAATGAVEGSHTEHTAGITAVGLDAANDMAYTGSGASDPRVRTWGLDGDGMGGVYLSDGVTAIAAGEGGFVVGLADGTVESDGLDGNWEDADRHGTVRGLALSNGTVYSAGRDVVKAANGTDGSVRWSHTEHSGDLVSVAASADGETVYSSGTDGSVLAYDAASGAVAWNHSAHTVQGESLSYDSGNGTLYSIGSDTARVYGFQDRRETEDAAVDLDGDGTPEASVSGTLADGETVTRNVSLSTSTTSADVSTTGGTEVGLALTWEEVTESVDPGVTVNGHTVDYDGTLAAGNSTTLDVSAAWLTNGTNNVSVGVSQVADGPPGMVAVDYAHRAVEDRSVAYGATTWSETYTVSKTWESDVEDAVLRVPWASDRVLSVRSVAANLNGSTLDPERVDSTNGTLAVELGAVPQGATVNVTAVGSKVRASGGTIRVTNATEEGLSLDSEVRVESLADPSNFSIAVGGTHEGHLLHYATGATWSGADGHLTVSPDGSQDLHLDAAEGGTFRVRTAPVELRPEGAPVEAIVHDADAPRFRVREAAGSAEADSLDVVYHAATEGETYELYSETEERGVDTATASSPVTFLTDGDDETYSIRLYDSPSATGDGAAVAVGSDDGGSGLGLAPAAVVLGAGLAVVGAVLVGRRFGITGRGGTVLLGVVALVVAAVATEAVTRGSVLALVVEAVLDPLVDSQVGVVGGGIGLLLAVYAVHDWIGLPWWVLALAVAGDAIWVLDAVTGGALGAGLGTVSPLLWLLGVLGGLYLLYTHLSPRDITIRR